MYNPRARPTLGQPSPNGGQTSTSELVLRETLAASDSCIYRIIDRASTCKPAKPSTAKRCIEEGCDRRPIYAYKGNKKPTYCAGHR